MFICQNFYIGFHHERYTIETKLYESVSDFLVLNALTQTRQNLRYSHTQSITVHVDEGLDLNIDLYLCSAGYISIGVY